MISSVFGLETASASSCYLNPRFCKMFMFSVTSAWDNNNLNEVGAK